MPEPEYSATAIGDTEVLPPCVRMIAPKLGIGGLPGPHLRP